MTSMASSTATGLAWARVCASVAAGFAEAEASGASWLFPSCPAPVLLKIPLNMVHQKLYCRSRGKVTRRRDESL